MDKPMDETDRKHCLLDLHGIRERISPEAASVEFVRRWGSGLETVLKEAPQATLDGMQDNLDEMRRETDDEIKGLESVIDGAKDELRAAIDRLNEIYKDLEGATS